MKTIKVRKNEQIAYDPHLLDGIEYVDDISAEMFMKSMINCNARDKRSPYSPVRMLINYFDKDTGILRHGSGGTAAFMKFLMRRDNIRRAVRNITIQHSAILDLLYVQKDYRGAQLVERVSWKVKAIIDDVRQLLTALRDSEFVRLFGNTEAVKGRSNGKVLGLSTICERVAKNLGEIDNQIDRLNRLMKKGKDPFSYSCIPAYKTR